MTLADIQERNRSYWDAPRTLYHVTHPSNVAAIKKQGLKPSHPRGFEEGEQPQGVYLSKHPNPFNPDDPKSQSSKERTTIEVKVPKGQGQGFRRDPSGWPGGVISTKPISPKHLKVIK